jgi:hypothetical protein
MDMIETHFVAFKLFLLGLNSQIVMCENFTFHYYLKIFTYKENLFSWVKIYNKMWVDH